MIPRNRNTLNPYLQQPPSPPPSLSTEDILGHGSWPEVGESPDPGMNFLWSAVPPLVRGLRHVHGPQDGAHHVPQSRTRGGRDVFGLPWVNFDPPHGASEIVRRRHLQRVGVAREEVVVALVPFAEHVGAHPIHLATW